jgi:hypothetical protein
VVRCLGAIYAFVEPLFTADSTARASDRDKTTYLTSFCSLPEEPERHQGGEDRQDDRQIPRGITLRSQEEKVPSGIQRS